MFFSRNFVSLLQQQMYELTATKVHSIFFGEKKTNRVTAVGGLRENVSDDDAGMRGDEMQEG